MTARKLLVAALLVATALPAAAEEEAESSDSAAARVAADGTVIRGSASSPWRGSWLSYDHVFNTVGLDKGAELTWNPYYAQSLTISPRYYLSDEFFVSASWSLEQELTDSDWTTKKREIVWSDLFVDVGWIGWQEPTSQIRITPTLRIGLPISQVSAASTQILSLAGSVRLSRNFSVLQGLNVSWSGRWTQRFHDSTTPVKDETGVVGCEVDSTCDAAESFANQGYLNAWGDLSTGPSLVLSVFDGFRLNADMRVGKSFLYDNADGSVEVMGEERKAPSSAYARDFDGRYNTYFGLGAAYDIWPELTLSAGVSTPSPQLGADGERRSPFFNRYTQIGFGVSLDVDVFSSRLFPRG